jgi:hypothetical protein
MEFGGNPFAALGDERCTSRGFGTATNTPGRGGFGSFNFGAFEGAHR